MNALIRLRTLAPVLALAACTLTTAAHACPSTAPGRFVVNAAGDEVTDTHTGLVWRRCSEGQDWDASTQSCDGKLSINMTHEQAMAHAQAQGGGWRVPSLKELHTLVDRACHDPAIDSSLFPGTTAGADMYWTSTPRAGVPNYAWIVGFGVGSLDTYKRDRHEYVRLVRASQ